MNKRRWICCTLPFVLLSTVSLSSLYAEEDVSRSALEQEKQIQQGEALLHKIRKGTPRFQIVGALEQDSEGVFRVNGETFRLSSETRVEGTMAVGAEISVSGFIENGARVARVVIVNQTTAAKLGGKVGGLDLPSESD